MRHGGDELERLLDELAQQGAARGWYARIRWLTDAKGRRARTVEHFGHTSRDPGRLILSWLASGGIDFEPSAANREAIATLYAREYRASRGPTLKRRLAHGATGHGSAIEVHAAREIVEQSDGGVSEVQTLHVAPQEWESIIDRWERRDNRGLRNIWEDLVLFLYPPRAYVYVEHLGIG